MQNSRNCINVILEWSVEWQSLSTQRPSVYSISIPGFRLQFPTNYHSVTFMSVRVYILLLFFSLYLFHFYLCVTNWCAFFFSLHVNTRIKCTSRIAICTHFLAQHRSIQSNEKKRILNWCSVSALRTTLTKYMFTALNIREKHTIFFCWKKKCVYVRVSIICATHTQVTCIHRTCIHLQSDKCDRMF